MSGSTQVHRHCPVCDNDQPRERWQKAALRLVECQVCSMTYADPVEEQFVSGAYYDQAGSSYYLSQEKLESDYAPVRFERELSLFLKYSQNGSVLDVGCSSGAFLFQLKQRFPNAFQILGMDASGRPLDYAESRGIPVCRGDFLKKDFREASFDAVTFWAVLEHLPNPRSFLTKATSILKPGGYAFVLVPNMNSLAVRILQSRYRYIYPQHLNYFTRETLAKLVPQGLLLVEVRSTHFNPIVIWQDLREKNLEVSNEERARLLKRTTALKQNPILKPVKGLYRFCEAVLGKLNLADNLVVVLRRSA